MTKLGTEKKPAIVRVQNEHRAQEIGAIFDKNGWKFIIGIEPDKPEDISDLEKLLNPPKPVQSAKIGRNDPCPCGSGKKYKKCCG
jgi:SWIM/SEC-C metal-binding protein